MAPKHYSRHRHLVLSDASFELRRARARVGNKPDGMKSSRFLKKKGSMDEVYKKMLLSLLATDKCSMDEVYKKMLLSLLMDDKADARKVETDKDDAVELVKRPVPLTNWKSKSSIIDQHDDDHGRVRISDKNKALVLLGNDFVHHRNVKENKQLIQFQGDHGARAQPVTYVRKKIRGKFKGVVKEENEANKKIVVKKENGNTYQGCGSRKNSGTRNYCQDVGRVCGQTELMKVAQGDDRLSSKKTAFVNCSVKKEPYHCVETRLPIKEVHSQIRNVKRAKCAFAYISDQRYFEAQGSNKNVPEVIILDSDKIVKKEIFSPFVSSTRYHSSMANEESKKLGLRRAIDNEFRKELLEVLRDPFDKEELQRSREAFRAGSYAVYHPDVQRKLTKYRYKREKCLIILRGFLFWLQNVSREGAFQPWKDKQCLKLELPPR